MVTLNEARRRAEEAEDRPQRKWGGARICGQCGIHMWSPRRDENEDISSHVDAWGIREQCPSYQKKSKTGTRK